MAEPQTPKLVDIATQILKAATTLQGLLDDNGLPQPSFDTHGRENYHDALEFPQLLEARSSLIEASQSMLNLARGPTDTLRALVTTDRTKIMVLTAIDELKIAQAVPLDSSIAVQDLANKLHVHAAPLQRILRYAYTMHMFHEPERGHVAHTALSTAIPSFSPYIRVTVNPTTLLGGIKIPEALRIPPEMPNPVQPRIPVELAFPGQGNYWQIIQQDPHGMENFSAAMRTFGQCIVGPKYTLYIRGFDWKGLGKGPVVDLGGGNGHISSAIAKAHPGLQVIVQDLGANEGPAKVTIPHDLKDRVIFQAHDFFEPQPESLLNSPPKAYMLSRVLHDWPDADCVRILRPLVPAVEKGAKLFIVDRILPDEPGQVPLHQEAQLRNLDLDMFSFLGGKERSLGEWEALFREADSRLKIERSEVPVSSEMGVMEVGMI